MLNPFKRWRKRQVPPSKSVSPADYDDLVRDLAVQASQGASWPQILTTLQNQAMTPESVAQWMTTCGGKLIKQSDSEFGQGLLRLSEVAEGSLKEITATLGKAITQRLTALSPAMETHTMSEPADSAASFPNFKQSSVLASDLTVGQSKSVDPPPMPQLSSPIASDWLDEGKKLFELGRYEEATASCNQAIALQPENATAWVIRGALLHNNLGRYEEALASHEQAITLQPNNATAWGNRGITLNELGRYEEALTSYDQALSRQPDFATAWGNRGDTLHELGRYEEALTSYDQALSRQPDFATAWVNRGITLDELGHYEEALTSFDQAISRQPESATAWVKRGALLHNNLGRYEEALASHEQAITLQPDNATAWGNRGITLDKLECYEEALASYDQALSLEPDSAMAWNGRDLTLRNLGRYEEALASCDQALSLQPDFAVAWNGRGLALGNLGRYEEALASYDQALSLQPDFAVAWNGRGTTLGNLGRHKEALTSFDQAIFLQPNLAPPWLNRGFAVARLAYYRPEDESLFRLKIQQELDSRSRCALTGFFNRDVDAIQGHVLKSLRQSKTRLLQTFADTNNPQLLALIQQPPSPELEAIIAAPISAELQFLVNQPVVPKVLQQIEDDAARHPTRFRPELQVGGYQGQLNSYQAELGEHSQDEPKKAICKDTHPEGWGELHRAIGQAHYAEGGTQASPRPYWHKAANSFKRALERLQPPQFETLYFETLKDLIRALLGIGETQEVQTLQQEATAYIQRALTEPDRSEGDRQTLGLWLAKFEQLTVDAAIQAGDFRKALGTAETAKNVCLRWLLVLDEVPEVTFEQMQALVDEHTAMVYWHLSPSTLTTFLLLPEATEPVVIPPPDLAVVPTQALANDERPQGLKQILCWENWLSQWNQDYDHYSSAQNKTDKTVELTAWRRKHPWRTQMANRLESLGQLLNVKAIHAALQDYPIQRLWLIPHRDLHRLPLHTFFNQYDCTYLPSAKVGLDRLSQGKPPVYKDLLIAENPKSTATVKTLTQKLDELPFAEVEAELIRQQFRESSGYQPGRIMTLENQQVPYDRLLGALGQAQGVFHFTGHGQYNSRNPAQSCLFLTGGDRLTLADIVHPDPELGYHDLSAYQLVFLAACETGVAGNQTITDDYVGLVSAFLKAKASCVVSTLWRIESGSSLIFVSQFYQALLAGATPAQALRTAQIFLKTAHYDQIKAIFENYITLIERSELDLDRKELLQLVLAYQLRYLESKQQANSTIEAYSPSMPLYSHPYHWAAYTVSGL